MITETEYYTGGEEAILSIFVPKETVVLETEKDYINDLIAGCSSSKECLSELYVMFKSSVFALAYSITSDYHLSEDCVAETFIRLAQLKRFDPKKGDGKGVILTVARNVAMEIRRSHQNLQQDAVIRNYGEADKIVENSLFVDHLLSFLTEKQRQVVVLHCCSGLTFKEIAKIMKRPETTVKSRYKKAMAILQEKAGVGNEK
ncbi:MAG: sigma-70 family RNA polymerase sigma factor [Ruminococcus sp.]|nr:sigma-70 family RNA polymerase sigma factor [Ruminococcus sp.]